MNLKKIISINILIALSLFANYSNAQSVGIGATNPHPSAILDLTSTNKGLLLPRISDISNSISNPTAGLMVYDINKNKSFMYTLASWNEIIFSDEMPFSRISNRIVPFNHGAKLSLGMSNPTAKLHINHKSLTTSPFLTMVDSSTGSGQMLLFSKLGSTNNFKINTTLNNNSNTSFLSFVSGTNSNPILQLQANNKVSINKNTATETLDISGNIKGDTLKSSSIIISPNAGAGKVLTSNAQGVASWQQAPLSNANNTGDGYWGDCNTNMYLEDYQVVYDTIGDQDNFGWVTSMSGDFAAVSIPLDNGGKGSVKIYKLVNDRWEFFQKIYDVNSSASEYFGNALDLKGDRLIIGCPYDNEAGSNSGSAYIYHYDGTTWVFKTKLLAQTTGDIFGSSVAIDNNIAIVGAPYRNVSGFSRAGYVRVYIYNGTTWNLSHATFNPTPDDNDHFGEEVTLDSIYYTVGAPDVGNNASLDNGEVYFYKINGATSQLLNSFLGGASGIKLGSSMDLHKNYAVVGGAPQSGTGFFNIYQRNNDVWSILQGVTDPKLSVGDYFSSGLSINGDYIIAGAKNHSTGTLPAGAIFVYKKFGNFFRKLVMAENMNANDYSYLGTSVALGDTNRFIAGAPSDTNGLDFCAFGKIRF